MKRVLSTDDAPEAVGAYSQSTTNGELLFSAGQIPLTPDGELLNNALIAEQTQVEIEVVADVSEN